MKFLIKAGTALLALSLPLWLTGCQTLPYQPYARNVQVKPEQSGVIALKENHRDEDRQKALGMIATNCSNKTYKILEEGETVVGQKTVSSADESVEEGNRQTVGSIWGMPITSGKGPSKNTQISATTESVREWQIKYECAEATAVSEAAVPGKPKKRR